MYSMFIGVKVLYIKMDLFSFKINFFCIIFALAVVERILSSSLATLQFERPARNDATKQSMDNPLSLLGHTKTNTVPGDSLPSDGEELQNLTYLPLDHSSAREKRGAKKRHGKYRKTKRQDKCKKIYFRGCRCPQNYRLCKEYKSVNAKMSVHNETVNVITFRNIDCRTLCENCACGATQRMSFATTTASFETSSSNITAKSMTSSMSMNSSKSITSNVIIIHRIVEWSPHIIVLIIIATISCVILLMILFIRFRRRTCCRQKRNSKTMNQVLKSVFNINKTNLRRSFKPNRKTKKNMKTGFSFPHQLGQSFRGRDKENKISLESISNTFTDYLEGGTGNGIQNDLSIGNNNSKASCYDLSTPNKRNCLRVIRLTKRINRSVSEDNIFSSKQSACEIIDEMCTERKNEHNIPPVKQLVKECAAADENVKEVKISIVKPLTGPVSEQNKESVSSRLNWDEIFRYLAKILPTSDYKLFFNILYGNCHQLQMEGRETGRVIEKVETRVRRDSGDTETLMFELFNEWKQIMGSNVNASYIEEALSERSNNLVLGKFKEFMSKPPLLPTLSERSQFRSSFQVMNQQHFAPYYNVCNTPVMLPHVQQYTVLPLQFTETGENVHSASREVINYAHFATEEWSDSSSGPVIEEVGNRELDMVSLTSYASSSDSMSNRSSVIPYGEIMAGQKRLHLNTDLMLHEKEVIPSKVRKIEASTARRQRKQRQSTTAIALDDVKKSMVSLIKEFLPISPKSLEANQYDIFVEHTIESILKQTGETRNVVLSLTFRAYCEKEIFKTKRNDEFCFVYVKERCLTLMYQQVQNLRLYADFARKARVREITEQSGGKYKEPEVLFLSYDGKPLLKKKKVVRPIKKKSERNRCFNEASLDGNPSPTISAIVPAQRESLVLERDTSNIKSDETDMSDEKTDSFEHISNSSSDKDPNKNSFPNETHSKTSLEPLQNKNFGDDRNIVDKGPFDLNIDRKIVHFDDNIERKRETSENDVGEALSLKDNSKIVDMKDMKREGADFNPCNSSTEVNVDVSQQNIPDRDLNICHTVGKNSANKSQKDLVCACLVHLIKNEVTNDKRITGAIMPIDLD